MSTVSVAPNKTPVIRWIAGLAYLLLTLEVVVLAVFVRPSFELMFKDIAANLPSVSAAALSPSYYYAFAGLGIAGMVGAALLRQQRLLTLIMVAAAVLVIAFPGTTFYALYLPVYQLAGAVESGG